MLSIKNITNAPAVRHGTAPDPSQAGSARDSIDPATSRLSGSITYDRENNFNLEWHSKEALKHWLDNEQRQHTPLN